MHPPDRRVLSVLVPLGALAFASAFAACHTTEDPRPGLAKRGATVTPDPLPPPIDAGIVPDASALPPPPLECGPAPFSTAPFTKQALLGAAADCAAFHACTFENAATVLKKTLEAAKESSAENRGLTQLAFRNAMSAWSSVEGFQFGPVAGKAIDKYHGRGLRALVHPWPDTSRCQVESQVGLKGYKQGFDLVFPSGRGLFALEYLLHYPGTDTSCSAGSTGGQAWSVLARAPGALQEAKQEYALAVATDIVGTAQVLNKVWSTSGENFKAKLLAFDGYGSEQETLNVVAWSLLYPEQQIKDIKLGSLAGFQPAAPILETPFARIDIENIRTNLRAFRSLFQGCGPDGRGIGFDDWLVAAGNGALAKEIQDLFTLALSAADGFPTFQQATPGQFSEFYLKVRPLANLLKINFFGSASPLNLKLPASAASDTD